MLQECLKIKNVSKVYKIYRKPGDRIREAFSFKNKNYHKKFYALKDISIEINKGEILGVIGKNGSGKSTLLKIITGVLTPTKGSVYVHGKISALLELGTGFNMEYTGLENIYLVGLISGFSREEMNSRLPNIIDFADIGSFINQPVKTYSSGMFARLAFAVSINVDPDILVVDEALAVGDMKFQLKCMDKFNEFRDKGKTILFVTHDINSVKRFCTRSIWINEGAIVAEGDVNQVTDLYLDFLKISQGEEIRMTEEAKPSNKQMDLSEADKSDNSEKLLTTKQDVNQRNEDLVNILNLKILDENMSEIRDIHHNQKVIIELEYEVNGYYDKDIVIGIAILRIDNLYVCGLNTLLDKISIVAREGKQKIYLEYENINLMSGRYYFDCGIFEKNAYVPLDYRAKIKEFSVVSDYIGEGITILNHIWREDL